MGKSNRIRTKRANSATNFSAPAHKKNTGMPSWAMNLIAIAVAAVILVSVVLSLMTANGVFMRMQTAMKSDNFRVNGNMMDYFFKSQYNNFLSTNEDYLTYYGIDTNLPLKEQYLDPNDESQGTWFDYIMSLTTAEVTEMLVYCEEAEARGIELEDAEKDSIDAELDLYKTYATMYGYTDTNTYIAAIYGSGIKLKDIRNCLEMSYLASKCSSVVGEEILDGITDEDINAEYESNKLNYDLVDYTFYDFKVTYKDAIIAVLGEDYDDETAEEKSEEIIAKYKELIANAKTKADSLAGKTDIKDFKATIVDIVMNEVFVDTYDEAIADSELTSDKLPTDENKTKISAKIIESLIDTINNDKTYEKLVKTEGEKNTIFDVEITAEYAEELEEIIEEAYDSAKLNIATYERVGVVYNDTDEANEWMFEDERKAGDVKTFEEGDGADDKEISDDADELDTFTVSAYYVNKTQYRNEELTRDLGLMLFADEESAKAAIEKLSAGITLEQFEAVSNDNGGSYTKYENYGKGDMGVADFDTWLYGDDVKKGDYTSAPIKLSDSSYAVVLYAEDGDAVWSVTVQSNIYSEEFSANYTALSEKFAVTTNDKTLAKIDEGTHSH